MRHPLPRFCHFLSFTLTLSCCAVTVASAQSLLSVYDIFSSPTIRAKFGALDAVGTQVRGLTPSDFSGTRNGTLCTHTSTRFLPEEPVDPPQQAPTLKLTYPNGNEKLTVGDTVIITWEGNLPSDRMMLQFSTNAGATWRPVMEMTRGIKYSWKVPQTPSNSCLMRVMQLDDRASMIQIPGHNNYIYSSSFSPDGLTIITAGGDGTAKLWDAQTGDLISSFPGNYGAVTYAVFSPDGQTIAAGDESGTVKLWDIATKTLLHSLPGFRQTELSIRPGALNFSPDGTMIVAGGWLDSVKVWETATGNLINTFYPGATIFCTKFTPDGKQILVTSGSGIPGSESATGSLSFWDYQTPTLHAQTDSTGLFWSISYNSDGNQLVASNGTRSIGIWSMENDISYLRSLKGGTSMGGSRSVEFSPTGNFVISSSRDQYARLWDATTGTVVESIPNNPAYLWPPSSSVTITTASFSPDGRKIVTTYDNGSIRIWKFPSLQEDSSDFLWSIVDPNLSVDATKTDREQSDRTAALKPVRPNPTNDRAEIEYEVTEQGRTQLYITDMLGRRVATLVDGEVAPGRYIIQWNPAEQASGMFFCTLQTPTGIRVERLEVQK